MSAARDAATAFAARDTIVLGMNPGSLASHQKFSGLFDFHFPLLVDRDKAVATAYAALKENGGINRSVFLVDQQGIIRWAKPGTPSTEEILAAIDAL